MSESTQWSQETPDLGSPYWMILGKRCRITLEARPHYCDRGNFIAKIHVTMGMDTLIIPGREVRHTSPDFQLEIDDADAWPRYYFDEERAKLEIEAWLKKRKEWIG